MLFKNFLLCAENENFTSLILLNKYGYLYLKLDFFKKISIVDLGVTKYLGKNRIRRTYGTHQVTFITIQLLITAGEQK